ncbi:MAG: hypothetical protein V1739_07450 [Candidatus Omnitrophota bacterium]
MRKLLLVVSIAALVLCVYHSESLAKEKGSGQSNKAQKMDRNKDGMIDRKEQIQAKQKIENREREEKQTNNWWRKRADTDNDGKVSDQEEAAWKKMTRERIDMDGDGVISSKERRLSWRHAKSRVNTKLEKQYDANNDGWLEPEEAKNLLRSRRELLKTKEKAKVDSEVEAGYDTDENGIIDAGEAAAMSEDIQ